MFFHVFCGFLGFFRSQTLLYKHLRKQKCQNLLKPWISCFKGVWGRLKPIFVAKCQKIDDWWIGISNWYQQFPKCYYTSVSRTQNVRNSRGFRAFRLHFLHFSCHKIIWSLFLRVPNMILILNASSKQFSQGCTNLIRPRGAPSSSLRVRRDSLII